MNFVVQSENNNKKILAVAEIKHEGESEAVPLMIQVTIVTSFAVAAVFPLTTLQGGECERTDRRSH